MSVSLIQPASPMTQSVWTLKDVTLAGRVRPRLADLSLEIPPGVTAVMGSSGAGKYSLLGLLTEFETPDSGTVTFQAPETKSCLPLFWSPQDHGLWPHLTVQQHIEYVRPASPRIDRSVVQWLELLSLGDLKNSLPELLSQGERSRLAMARTLASEASVIVMDEPMVHVDPLMAHGCWDVIANHIHQHCAAAVFSTHHPDTVLKHAHNVICLQDGSAVFSGPVKSVFMEPPTRELAWLLGPCNWFVDEMSSRTTGDEWPICVRPSQLEVLLTPDGRFVVESIMRAATVVELRMRHHTTEAPFTVFIARAPAGLSEGATIELAYLPDAS